MACQFSTSAVTLFIHLLLQLSPFGSCSSFCINTLSRQSCPDLKTFDQFDITAFGGRWYEIGSNAYFKNLDEAGGTCVTADYTSLKNGTTIGTEASFSVVNSFNKQIGPLAASVVQSISLRAGEVCQQARQICIQTNQQGALLHGLSIVDGLASALIHNFSLEGGALVSAKLQIEDAVKNINQTLEFLSSNITQIQLINSNLSQARGGQADSVDALAEVARQGNVAAEAIRTSVNEIGVARLQIANIAGLLFGISKAESYLFGENSSLTTAHAAVQLFKAASLIQSAEEVIPGPLAVISATLAGATASTATLNLDKSGPATAGQGSTQFLRGQAVQLNASRSGRLVVTTYNQVDAIPGLPNDSNFPVSSTTAHNYWILAVEGTREAGYDAALIYECHELPTGGVKQPLFILSRKPTIAPNVVAKFFNLAATLGIDMDCDEPFVFGQQGDSCVYPPT